ncbi:MAG TPA: SurA N-terminal domain-containing protein [Longimicrobiales bacterium]|nr:SurA N-terminal domain-containing protein [Longimicrobiales bacterium]
MMRQMRENTKWIMLITALAFVGLMVFEWGMDLTGRSGAQASGGELGRVNGEIITYEDYLAVYRNLYQQQQEALDGRITSAMNRQIEDAAWEQVVTQRLLQQELRRRGIRVTDDEIREAALYAPPPDLQESPLFQTDGRFDPVKYQQFLASPGLDEQFLRQLESYYRDIIPRSKLYFQNTAGLFVSDDQLWRMWRDARETATVEYVAFAPDALVPDADVTVTDQAIRQYYSEKRDEFVRPAVASVRYAALDRTPTAADTAGARDQATALRQAVVDGADFDEVARRTEDDGLRSPLRTNVFTVVQGQSMPELDAAIFATPAGQVTAPVLTQAGYHVIRVDSRRADTAEVRQILVPVVMADEAEFELLNRADELERAAVGSGLAEAATRAGLEVRSSELSPALPVLPGIGSADEGVDWAFEEGEPGETSPVFEGDDAFYIMELVSRRDEGVLSLQEATPTIRSILMRRAKVERARQVLADAERRAAGGEPLEQVAAPFNAVPQTAGPFTRSDFVPGLGRFNAAIGAAFGLRPGDTTPLVEADQQLFLIRGTARETASRTEWQGQLAEQRERVLQAMADARWNQYMLALREDANIVDNRSRVLRRGGTTANGF